MKKKILTYLLAVCSALPLHADEGMWMLTDLKQQNEIAMKELGLLIPLSEVYSPEGISLKDAVVHFGGGCTGEVISANGLVLTNHHCGYEYIQQHSSVQHDYLSDGFWAMTQQEELPCKDLSVTFIDRIMDVTDYVKRQLRKERKEETLTFLSQPYLEQLAKKFAKEERIKSTPGMVLELKPFYGGNKYYLFVKTVYSDVRMVGGPPSSIGKFGADTDNWMWPRHTGDFSLFRIYADKNGKPAPYSPNNVPLHVKKHLRISLAGYNEGDMMFVMGFPGRNWRYMIADEVKERMETTNFMRHHVREVRQQILSQEMAKDPAVRIHYAAKYASSANYWKNAIGMNEGLIKLHVLDTKRRQQEELLAYGRQKGDNRYRQAFDTLQEIVRHRRQPLYHRECIGEALVRAQDWMAIPRTEAFAAALRSGKSKEVEREAAKLRTAAARYFADVQFPEVERKVGKAMLATYTRYIPKEERIDIFSLIDSRFGGRTDAFVDACMDSSIFASAERFEAFMAHPDATQLDNDLMVQFKRSITAALQSTAKQMEKETAAYAFAHRTWVEGMMRMRQEKGLPIYPDANSTLRLTYGKVRSYAPADAIRYDYRTTLAGVMEKENPESEEFTVPARLKELFEQQDYGRYALPDGSMPVCYIIDTDNTGGNSGSPVFNAKGELVGTGFDRNYEGLTGDIAFRPESQRAAVVDIRYTLFIIDKFAGCKRLIEELDFAE